ncbi:MAG TPA: alpha-glucan family phosphorylase [Pyrinomonadaceae bacterium]|jgi:starch phosphorylase|nr:alpha-glucan family phosphorylase [Pyrinomonadaceae bacterium]
MVQLTEEIEHTGVRTSGRDLPLPLRPLERLAWNYWWSWARDGAAVFRDLDPSVWEECEHNPRRLLSEVSEFRLMQMATDPVYGERVRRLAESFDEYMADQRPWRTDDKNGLAVQSSVAYFCAEYGVHNSLPLYSGGLGMLAGDHLKSASDLRLPLVAVGLLYRYGYFRQRLRRDGWQEEHYGETQPSQLPIRQVLDEAGSAIVVEVSMRGRTVRAQAWRVGVGRVSLYLLDTNIPENEETDRLVTGHLYGGDRETRIVQEMMLGIGGVRLLRALGIEPRVFHLNEGHSAFLTLELARELIGSNPELSFEDARAAVRERCVFTTHTPVAAGNDEFEPALVEKCFGTSFEQSLKLSHEQFLNMGRVHTGDEGEAYGLTPLAIRMCRSTNGVSRKHGEVSRALWQEMWPERPSIAEIPITSVTNGVHAPTWISPLLRALFESHMGPDWQERMSDHEGWSEGVRKISDEELWRVHLLQKQRLVAFIRHRSFHARLNRSESMEYTEAARTMFDPEALIIGFARRVAGYKRWSLLLTDPHRLLRLINDAHRPVQFVFAGKAHPQDQGAKFILQQLALWKYDPLVRHRAVFLQDYDQEIARQLVQSVDVWLNVPRRPLEASGTSGEKVAMNGGLNLSILDGWWLEGYDGTNGFAIGDLSEDQVVEAVDERDAESLYYALEHEVVPLYYEREADRIPHRWVAMMKRSIETLAPAFNSDRMVREYAEKIYT